MNNRLTYILFTLLLSVACHAQETWTLERCINYALKNNISIKQSELETHYQANELSQTKYNLLPNLNASASQNFGFGRAEDKYGILVPINAATTGVSINSSVDLYTGGVLGNQIKKQEVVWKASLEKLEKAKDDISVEIARNFLTVLLNKELVRVAAAQLFQTEKQIEQTTRLVGAGTLAKGDLLEIEAQQAREILNSVEAKNNYKLALLNLAQLLELDHKDDFTIEPPMFMDVKAEMSLAKAHDVYHNALSNRHEIKSSQLELESSEYDLRLAKASRIPSLSANMGASSNYISDYSGNSPSFSSQLSDNQSSYIGLSLNVPIFNKFQVSNGVKNAQIQVENKQLGLEATKKQLRLEIEQAYFNAVAAHERYNANISAVVSMEESFRYMTKKVELGSVSSIDYNAAKTNIAKAQSELLQAKYEFVFLSKILDFYNGIDLSL